MEEFADYLGSTGIPETYMDTFWTMKQAVEVMKALGDAYDVGQPAGTTSAIGRYRAWLKTETLS